MPRTVATTRAPRSRWPKGAAPPVLVEVRRGGLAESRHRGHIVQVGADGEIQRALGDPEVVVTLRSCIKPFSLVALLESGAAEAYQLTDPELAVMAASHGGEDLHVRTLQGMFRRSGLSQTMLGCGAEGAPLDELTAARLARDGEAPSPIRHMCSGHHAASLLLSRHRGWPLEQYWMPDHPSQLAGREALARALRTGPETLKAATDACGVPTYAMPLSDVARLFARLAAAQPAASVAARTTSTLRTAGTSSANGSNGANGSTSPSGPGVGPRIGLRGDAATRPDPHASLDAALARIRRSMASAPELVAGSRGRLDTQIIKATEGRVVAKAGAEGLRGIGIEAGVATDQASGVAITIDDGDGRDRASHSVTVEVLAQIGVLRDPALRRLAEFHRRPLRDPRGEAVGEVVPVFQLAPISELL